MVIHYQRTVLSISSQLKILAHRFKFITKEQYYQSVHNQIMPLLQTRKLSKNSIINQFTNTRSNIVFILYYQRTVLSISSQLRLPAFASPTNYQRTVLSISSQQILSSESSRNNYQRTVLSISSQHCRK